MRRKRRAHGILRRLAAFVRAQAEREEQARLIDHLAALDHARHGAARGVMAPHPPRRAVGASVDDPLERLWDLPAWSRDA
jgi:hypothetical protein